MDAFNSDPELAAYARFWYAYYSRDAPIVIDERVADFASCEGAQQGDPASCANYAFATHACAVALDAELWRPAASPGSRSTTASPANVVFPALRRDAAAVRFASTSARPGRLVAILGRGPRRAPGPRRGLRVRRRPDPGPGPAPAVRRRPRRRHPRLRRAYGRARVRQDPARGQAGGHDKLHQHSSCPPARRRSGYSCSRV